ncbi:MAG: SRPBCC domain-containing protein [Pyrinomonadaceae bacterium]
MSGFQVVDTESKSQINRALETRDHKHREEFAVAPDAMFDALITPSAIREWWGAANAIVFPKVGGFWCAAWGDEDSPDYITKFRIADIERPFRIVFTDTVYYAKSGRLPFEADFTTMFKIDELGFGCSLTVTQEGFPCGPEADEHYEACIVGWKETFAGIRRYFEKTD